LLGRVLVSASVQHRFWLGDGVGLCRSLLGLDCNW
jgi:hypothetical protein